VREGGIGIGLDRMYGLWYRNGNGPRVRDIGYIQGKEGLQTSADKLWLPLTESD